MCYMYYQNQLEDKLEELKGAELEQQLLEPVIKPHLTQIQVPGMESSPPLRNPAAAGEELADLQVKMNL